MGRARRTLLRIALSILLFLILFLIANFLLCPSPLTDEPVGPGGDAEKSGALSPADSLAAGENGTGDPAGRPAISPRRPASTPLPSAADSAGLDSIMIPDTSVALGPPPDRTPPMVWAEPGPGLHESPVEVTLKADEPARLEYRLNGDTAWCLYERPLPVNDSAEIVFRGADSAGNSSAEITRAYFIQAGRNRRCPEGMVYVTAKGAAFCVDRYEWPNQKGARPLSFINWYMAGDSCRLHKKRLCTGDEWAAACAGRFHRTYPYGDVYENPTCRTEDQSAAPAGAYPECRSFFGAYDMSGNVREWTASRAGRSPSHFDVYGGFWDSKSASTCGSSQFSFFPENKFIAVGFRCCAGTIRD